MGHQKKKPCATDSTRALNEPRVGIRRVEKLCYEQHLHNMGWHLDRVCRSSRLLQRTTEHRPRLPHLRPSTPRNRGLECCWGPPDSSNPRSSTHNVLQTTLSAHSGLCMSGYIHTDKRMYHAGVGLRSLLVLCSSSTALGLQRSIACVYKYTVIEFTPK